MLAGCKKYCNSNSPHYACILIFVSSVESPVKNATVTVTFIDCGSVTNNILTSPRFPYSYPKNVDCNYTVPIPNGTVMEVNFNYFYLEDHMTCEYVNALMTINQ